MEEKIEGESQLPKINVTIKTKEDLYLASMPFVRDGGLFVATRDTYELGQQVHLEITLIDEDLPLEVEGKVIWITPQGAQGNLLPGIGVQFTSKQGHKVHKTIEHYLAGMDELEDPTDTM